MRRLALLAFAILTAPLTGCGIYVIHKSTPRGDFGGVPFYVKTAVCKHEIVRLEPYFVLTLTTKKGDKVDTTETTTLSLSQFNSPTVVNFRSAIASSATDGPTIRQLWNAVRQLHYEPHKPEGKVGDDDWFVIADRVAPEVYVDYQTPYTLNVRKPLIGTAKADVKLAEDGTLTEASAETEDKTVSTLLDLLPIKELIQSAVGIAAFDGGTLVTLELSIEEKGVKYTRTYRVDDVLPPCIVDVAKRKETGPYDIAIEDVKGAKKESVDDNSISVEGSIKLPKLKGPKPADSTK